MMRRSRGKPQSLNTTISIPVSTLATGAQSANAFTGWDSPATTVTQNSFWGAANTKYLTPGDSTRYIAKSQGISRDQEVSTWMQRGSIYLRLTDAGKALVFTATPEAGAYGVSVVSGVTEGVSSGAIGPGGGALVTNQFITALPALTSVPGYSSSSNAGHYWTFGCEGFDVYLKYNGVEFWRSKQFWHLEPGKVAIGAQTNYGFRDVTALLRVSATTYSDIAGKTFDVRDFGFKAIATTGAMTINSNILTVASNPGFAVGDQIIVATGGEAAGGIPGERGVGGCWPTLLFDDITKRNLNTTQAVGKVCGVLSNGTTYQWSGSAWVAPSFSNGTTYYSKIVPKALMATITAISGTTITLDQTATASTTSAVVAFDCRPYFAASLGHANGGFSTQTGVTVSFPAGSWAFGGYNIGAMGFTACNNLTVQGAGRDSTTLYSPPGCTSFTMNFFQCSAPIAQDMEIRGNFRNDKGYMTRFDSLDQYSNGLVNVNFSSSPNAVARRLRTYNNQQAAVSFNFCATCLASDIIIIHETGHRQYQQWAINVSDCSNCTIDGVTIDCPTLFSGAETFRSTGSILRNISGRNGLFSTNSSDGFLLENLTMIYETSAGDGYYDDVGNFPSPLAPLIDHNTNIDNTSGSTVGGGGISRNFNITIEGRPWRNSSVVGVFNISGTARNILIGGLYPTKPVTQPAGLITFPSGLTSARAVRGNNVAGQALVVDGIRVINPNGTSSIGDTFGTPPSDMIIRNCVIDNQTAGGTQTDNITNAAYEAL